MIKDDKREVRRRQPMSCAPFWYGFSGFLQKAVRIGGCKCITAFVVGMSLVALYPNEGDLVARQLRVKGLP